MNDKRVKVKRKSASVADAEFDLAMRQEIQKAVDEAIKYKLNDLNTVYAHKYGSQPLQDYIDKLETRLVEMEYETSMLSVLMIGIKSAIMRYHMSDGPLSEGITVLLDDLNGIMAHVTSDLQEHQYITVMESNTIPTALPDTIRQYVQDTNTHAYETIPVSADPDAELDDEMLDELRRYRQRET